MKVRYGCQSIMGPLVVLVLVGLMAHAVLGGSDCQGKVGAYSYDLSPLARQLGDNDVVLDDWGNTYFYSVCGVVSNTFCQTVDDMTPAVCQKDQRQPPQAGATPRASLSPSLLRTAPPEFTS
ncbi:uncharacterized protein ACA1_271960, partial [Acanthamoeba castellanii str. Neff]